jgi:hypothetical protein
VEKKMSNLFSKILIINFFLFLCHATTQDGLYIPLNIQNAYEKGTRAYDGAPGENYWQNTSEYKIKAEVDPVTRLLKGSEEIIYYNNSPDTLNRIIFNLFQDFYKYGSARDKYLKKEALSDGMVIEKIKAEDKIIDIEGMSVLRLGTQLTLFLDEPLLPSSEINFEIDWNFIIPKGSNVRMGTYDTTSFFVAYWFPHIAVYDDIDGWDIFDYTGQVEFYNDFSDYEVEITVPNNFAVWATGILQNPEEVLNDEYLGRYEEAQNSDSVINIVTKEDLDKGSIYNQSGSSNTWKYKAENVTDFAFSMSDHYLWDAASLIVDKGSERRIYVAAVYKKESQDFYHVCEIARKTVDFFSNVLPGIPFPYPCLTVFNGESSGGHGMEYPMILNDGSASTISSMIGLTSHEAAHQYFPFYTGINEKKYAWMDEGMAVFLPYEFQESMTERKIRAEDVQNYIRIAGDYLDMPMMTPSIFLKGYPYRVISYDKPGIAYEYLRELLGEELFNEALQKFIDRWNGKHPIPYDFFYTFNDIAEKDLSWYWKPWFFDYGYPDLGIKQVESGTNKARLLIEMKGVIPIPVNLVLTLKDNSEINIYKPISVWEKAGKEIWIEQEIKTPLKSVRLGSEKIPDVDESNNFYEME